MEDVSKYLNPQFLPAAIFGFLAGFIFAKISGKIFRLLFLVAIVIGIGYYYYYKK